MKEGRGKFGYFNNYLVDTEHAVIVDVEATPARLSQEIVATKTMLERVNKKHALTPEKLAADKAYGTGPFLGWLSQRSIVPHIPVLDRQHQTDGLLPREVFTFDPDKNHYICPENKILKNSPTPADSRFNAITQKRLIADHVPSANNAPTVDSAACPCLWMKVSDSRPGLFRIQSRSNNRAASARR